MKPVSLGHRGRLRERFLHNALQGFALHETIELLLTLAIPRRDVKPQARALMERFGSLRGILDAEQAELAAVPGMGQVAPVALKLIPALCEEYLRETLVKNEQFLDLDSVSKFWRLRLGGLKHEEFHVAYLDSSHRLLKGALRPWNRGFLTRLWSTRARSWNRPSEGALRPLSSPITTLLARLGPQNRIRS